MANCLDRHCYHDTQQNIKRWLIPSIIFLFVLAIAVVVILHFAVVPMVDANVEDARLDTFEFTTTTTPSLFRYDISVALIVRNPNQAMSIKHTKKLVATFIFYNRRLCNRTVVGAGHRHGSGNKQYHSINATGQVPALILGAAGAEDFKKQNATGLFMVDVRLSGEITFWRIAVGMKRQLSMSCSLTLQLAPPGPEVVVFDGTRCMHVKPDKIHF